MVSQAGTAPIPAPIPASPAPASGALAVTGAELLDWRRRLLARGGAASDQGGGGVYTDGGDLTITDSVLRSNPADGAAGSGGAVLNNMATVVIRSSTLSNNQATRAGGGVEANLGDTTFSEGSVLDSNLATSSPGNGGGLHLTGAGTVGRAAGCRCGC